MSINNNDEVSALLRLEAAVRVRNYVKEYSVGDDLGIRAEVLAITEANKALNELEKIRGSKFDAKASYEEMFLRNAKKKAE